MEPIRMLGVVDLLAMFVAGALLFGQWARTLPWQVQTAGYAVGGMFALIVAGIVVNAVSPIEPTPGIRIVAWCGVVPMLIVVAAACWSWKHKGDH